MLKNKIDFNEKDVVEALGMKYHEIPSITETPDEKRIAEFLKLCDSIIARNGRLHIHCMLGADRTGMYSFIYKSIKNIGLHHDNIKEWISSGLFTDIYPHLLPWAVNYLKKLR